MWGLAIVAFMVGVSFGYLIAAILCASSSAEDVSEAYDLGIENGQNNKDSK